MFGLSPLSASHPLGFQPKWVRPSTGSYPRFSLPWDSSPGFASTACDSNAILKARSRCGSLHSLTSPHTVTRWLILQKARRHHARWLRLLVGTRFQVLFHSPPGVLFTFPSRYWSTIGHRQYSALEGGPPGFGPRSTCAALLGNRARPILMFRLRGRSPSSAGPSRPFGYMGWSPPGRASILDVRPHNPRAATPRRLTLARVWARCAFARRYSRNLG